MKGGYPLPQGFLMGFQAAYPVLYLRESTTQLPMQLTQSGELRPPSWDAEKTLSPAVISPDFCFWPRDFLHFQRVSLASVVAVY